MEAFDLVVIGAGWHGLAMAKTYLDVRPTASIIIVDSANSVGGTWAKERLYPGLKTNNLLGSYEFSEFPMSPERFDVKPGQHIPGHAVHDYLSQFANHFNLMPSMRLGRKVESATLLDDGRWQLSLKVLRPQTSRPGVEEVIAEKLVVATGLTSEPFVPAFSGQQKFKRDLFHAKELQQRADGLAKLRQVAVLGGNKSAWDTCFFAAQSGAHVNMIMRPGGGGPSWVWPVFFSPLQLSIQRIAMTRWCTWLDPCVFGEQSGPAQWICYLLHKTFVGRTIVSLFWNLLAGFAGRIHRYDDHPETRKLRPWMSPLWMGNSLSIHNYTSSWFDLVRQGRISVHIADIERLSEGTIHLSDNTDLQVDALVCCTGWKTLPPVRFTPEGLESKLGLNGCSVTDGYLVEKARTAIFSELPSIRVLPSRAWPSGTVKPMVTDEKETTKVLSRYYLYRYLVPSDPTLLKYKNIAFIGAHLALGATTVAQAQALWIAAYFLNEIPHLNSNQIDCDRVKYETVLHNEYTRIRHPHAAGGAGDRCPDLAFDCLPYVDQLLNDLGVNPQRKVGVWAEMTSRYWPKDYQGITQEWLNRKQ